MQSVSFISTYTPSYTHTPIHTEEIMALMLDLVGQAILQSRLLSRLRQENHKLKAYLGYRVG